MYKPTIMIVIILLLVIVLTVLNTSIIEFTIILISSLILKLIMQNTPTADKMMVGGESKIINNSNGDIKILNDIIKKISNNYDDFNQYKKLFIKDIDIKKNPTRKLSDIKHKLKYASKNAPIKRGDHIGQRKLLLSEVQFLTKVGTKYDIKYCIYAGAAPGHKTHYLSKLFPNIKFILVDPNKFNMVLVDNNKSHRTEPRDDIVHIYSDYPSESNHFLNKKIGDMDDTDKESVFDLIKNSKYKIFIIEDFMDDTYSELFKKLEKCVFVSDIRSNTSNTENLSHPSDIDIYWNTSMMYNWINIIQPEASLLKIRMPFFNKDVNMKMYENEFKTSKKYGIDFIDDYKNFKFKMCKSTMYLQAWSRKTSGEMRMYIEKDNINNIEEYNLSDIEDKLFYFNLIDRSWHMHKNENSSIKHNFCYCNDCALENDIWVRYLKYNNTYVKSVHAAVELTNIITNRSLFKVHKGTVWKNLTTDLEKFNKVYNNALRHSPAKKDFGVQKGNKGKN
jgi:hypothetical protein